MNVAERIIPQGGKCSLTYTGTSDKLFISNNGIIMGYL
jgi:hypothetical protein